ncbi:MAG: hypothetical protein KBC42_01850 [Candidatus Pacebacteria bacterium]|nr:hypothetical protein [Candidatus Paceibacterota bacterium]MBP9780647.1 hypothetical protein [Candidatus Paceibacterota bacterium]
MNTPSKQEAILFPDFHNIYIQDRKFWSREDAPEMMDDSNLSDESAEVTHVDDSKSKTMIGFHPYSDMHDVSVVAELKDGEPSLESGSWDHIVEASIEIQNDELEISNGMPGDANIVMNVSPGEYRVRIYFGNLKEEGKDAEEGDDHYLIQIWSAPFSPISVVKQWDGFKK